MLQIHPDTRTTPAVPAEIARSTEISGTLAPEGCTGPDDIAQARLIAANARELSQPGPSRKPR